MNLAELIENFSLDGISKSPSIFDETKMKWLSGEYIKAISNEEFTSLAMPFLKQSKAYGKYDTDKLLALVRTRVQIFSEIAEKLDFLEEFGAFDLNLFVNEKQKASIEVAKDVLPKIIETLNGVSDWQNGTLFSTLVELSNTLGIKKQALLWIARIAITGFASTAGGATEIAELLGKEETLRRLAFSLNLL